MTNHDDDRERRPLPESLVAALAANTATCTCAELPVTLYLAGPGSVVASRWDHETLCPVLDALPTEALAEAAGTSLAALDEAPTALDPFDPDGPDAAAL